MDGKTTATAKYWATTGIECGDWRVEAGNELVGYPEVLDIEGLLEIAAITAASPVKAEEIAPVIENAEVIHG